MTEIKKNAHIEYLYHSHKPDCYKQCEGTLLYEGDISNDASRYMCSVCYKVYFLGDGVKKWEGTPCTVTTLICGKTNTTIEQANIVFS